MTATAHAVLWRGGTDFGTIEMPLPEPGPGETLVRLTAATVCGSDRHTVNGRREAPCPSVLGHEGVGVVVSTDRGHLVDGSPVSPGTRVVFGVTRSCGRCEICRRGLTAKCTSVQKIGHESFESDWPLSGTYATHILLREGQAVVPVPSSLDDGVAATAGCAVATVMAVLERAGDLSGRRVLVNGLGMLGLVAVAAARRRGAAAILAVDPNAARLRLAQSLGATPVSPEAGASGTVDVSLELSGSPVGIRNCIDALGIGGTAVLAGSVAPVGATEVDPEWIVRGWRTITGVHNYEPRHLQEAVEFLASAGDDLPWKDILDGPITADQLAEEFRRNDVQRLRTVVTM
ncbi:putative phosphonate catabolism associated alcohol dehydrogenase [Rhodococcus sp. SMB37]|uniref:zinc-binding dehydrogenase n=1 Tax=Rhodococcus sp. SMB37 TaxID=2512213 RepID=UPI0010D9242C|nr:zinc-binding dehydrogenase [Rhodococcus sp. SMB37]TCN55825.1 putative phosphonate catabolism associated alcohol dehydrogenase [Rhodococcus sp. SMB37]